jgi:hypothetical protein
MKSNSAIEIYNRKKKYTSEDLICRLTPEIQIYINPRKKMIASNENIVLKSSPLTMSWCASHSIGMMWKLFEVIDKNKAITDSSILDLSCTSGVFSIAASMVGAKAVLAASHDNNTLEQNFLKNGIDVKTILINKISKQNKFDFIIYDFCSFPSVKLLKKCCSSLNDSGIIYITGLLDHYIPKIHKNLASHNLIEMDSGWREELAFLYLKKGAK